MGQEAPLGAGRGERQGLLERADGLLAPPEPREELATGRVQQVIAVELALGRERVDERQRTRSTLGLRDRHGAVEPHDRRRLAQGETVVERHDGAPVRVFGARRPCVSGCDRGLQREGARLCREAERLLDHPQALEDLGAVPGRAVLLGEAHELSALVDAGMAPRVREQAKRQQADGLAAPGQAAPPAGGPGGSPPGTGPRAAAARRRSRSSPR